MTTDRPVIAILGGTGKEGSGLALRWAHAGHRVIVGSRLLGRAEAGAAELNAVLGRDAVVGLENEAAATQASIVVLAVPYAAQRATAEGVRSALAGKILIDVTVPLIPPNVARVRIPDEGSAVQGIQTLLGGGVRVVSAFQNVSAHHLKEIDHVIDCDVLVCADDPAAADTVIQLAESIGMNAFYAGALANSIAAEALTSVLIAINKKYKASASGIRITGVPRTR